MAAQEPGDLPSKAGDDPQAPDAPEGVEERPAVLARLLRPRRRGGPREPVARRRLGNEAHLEVDPPVREPRVEPEERAFAPVDPAGDGPLVRVRLSEKPAVDRHPFAPFTPRRTHSGSGEATSHRPSPSR